MKHTALLLAVLLLARASHAQSDAARPSLAGAYGPWLADSVLGDGPAALSFRTGKFASVDEWRAVARRRALECIAPVQLGGVPRVTVTGRTQFDGLEIEFLSWQLPMGAATEAVLLKPADAKGPLPGVLALHDHGGNKFLGWRKIALTDANPAPIVKQHLERSYEGVARANALAKRGYVVLVHDTFPFASRRVRVSDVPERIRGEGVEPSSLDDEEGIAKYNTFAAAHEHVLEKTLLSAGTTWPGVFLAEDQRALDVLCARAEVDASRIGCCGLSVGGLRSVYLAGLDARIAASVTVGFMTTWRDFILEKAYTNTWMTYAPLLPRDLDFPEILALRAPAATLVLNNRGDHLFTLAQMQRADRMLAETFERAGAAGKYRGEFYDGPHKFDRAMQADAFAWLDAQLKNKPSK